MDTSDLFPDLGTDVRAFIGGCAFPITSWNILLIMSTVNWLLSPPNEKRERIGAFLIDYFIKGEVEMKFTALMPSPNA